MKVSTTTTITKSNPPKQVNKTGHLLLRSYRGRSSPQGGRKPRKRWDSGNTGSRTGERQIACAEGILHSYHGADIGYWSKSNYDVAIEEDGGGVSDSVKPSFSMVGKKVKNHQEAT